KRNANGNSCSLLAGARWLVLLIFSAGCRAGELKPGAVEADAVKADAVKADAVKFEVSEQPVETSAVGSEQVLNRSIAFHDPDGLWNDVAIPLQWVGRKADGTISMDLTVALGPHGAFQLSGQYGGAHFEYAVVDDQATVSLDGQTELSEEKRKSFALDREDGLFWRNYFGFLGGLPMCLRDPDVQLEMVPFLTELEERTVLAVRTSFDAEIGTDLWTFYFDQSTFELVGCRFDRADSERDGETLVFEGLCEVGGMQLPKLRGWSMNSDGKILGTDELFARPD
ncbi:MAG: hypothetical protein ACI87A_003456, partial [Planctomycetota bacterium]